MREPPFNQCSVVSSPPDLLGPQPGTSDKIESDCDSPSYSPVDRELLWQDTPPATEESKEVYYNAGSKLIGEQRKLHEVHEPEDDPKRIKGSKRKSEIPAGTIEKITKIFRGEGDAKEGINPSDLLDLVIKHEPVDQ